MILKALKKIEDDQADLSLKAALFRAELDALKNIPTDIIAIQVISYYPPHLPYLTLSLVILLTSFLSVEDDESIKDHLFVFSPGGVLEFSKTKAE